jgi:ABC-type transport system involved in cytochrome bd biosynthesis fused ATPase/permease subunit
MLGKSSLLSSILGEMFLKSGKIYMSENATIAYCDQRPFVVNATVKNNVLFDLPMNEQKFNEVLDVTCLKDDIKILTQGINTEIGERGITLSGGIYCVYMYVVCMY